MNKHLQSKAHVLISATGQDAKLQLWTLLACDISMQLKVCILVY